MKKIGLVAAAIAVLGALGWSGFWLVARGEISARLDAEIAGLSARGMEITHGAREIGGFPFGYRVVHRDVTLQDHASGAVYRLPEITSEVTAGDVDRLVTWFPEKFQVEVPVPPEAALGVDLLRFELEARNLVVISDGLSGARQEIAGTADTLQVETGGDGQRLALAFKLTGLDYSGTLPGPSTGGDATGATRLERVDYVLSGTTTTGLPFTFEGLLDKPVFTGRVQMTNVADSTPPAFGGSTYAMTYTTGASSIAIRTVSGPKQQGGLLTIAAGSTAGNVTVSDGMLEFAASSDANTITLMPQPPPESLKGEGLGAGLGTIDAIYKAPIAPGEAMAPFTLRLAVDDIIPNDTLWAVLDRSGTMPRDPARLTADIEGTGRITKAMAEMRPGEALPLEFGNVIVRALDLSGLGASVTTKGEVEFLQPVNLPQGSLTVRLIGTMQLIRKLVESGFLRPEAAQTAAVLAALYTRPGAAPGELVSEVEMTLDGITVNGQRIQ